jgi:tetratricopeptide (TPR) repeat protein
VSYKTPKPIVIESEDSDHESTGTSDDDSDNDFDDNDADAKVFTVNKLPLTWRGHSRGDLQDMWATARDYRNTGKFAEAEDMFSQVFLGSCHLLGNTNEDTVKVAYNLADLYADSGRMKEAVDMIEKVIQNHLEQWGYEDKRTQQNVLHAIELLNGWNRQADALALLSLSEQLLQSSISSRGDRGAHKHSNKKGKSAQTSIPPDSRPDLAGVTESILANLNPAKVEYGLGVARTHIAAKDQAAEGLLLAMIAQCEDHPELGIQHLKARAELLKLYEKMGTADYHIDAFENALRALERAWEVYGWKEEKIESLDFMEAALQLVANMLKCGYRKQARRMFLKASEKATNVFGSDDERTVWVLITIGLVYQTHMTWDDAEDWFEEAFAAALRNKAWGPKDGIVRSLQNAIDHQHFSYVSDEGRPFKTIFGVSGIKIMPGRLHLE